MRRASITYDAHNISRLLLRKQVGACLHDFAIGCLLLTARKTPYRDAWCISRNHLGGTFFPHVQVQATLNDTEKVLSVWVFMRLYAAVKPAYRAFHGLLHTRVVGRGGCDNVVELHDYVGAD